MQILGFALTVTTGSGLMVTVFTTVVGQAKEVEVPTTVYTVVTVGFTEMDGELDPVLQE
jgi:hypothetical protein